jgi:multidrug efflux pump
MWIGVSGPYSRSSSSDYARYRVKERCRPSRRRRDHLGGYRARNIRIWVDASALDATESHGHRRHRRAAPRARRAPRGPHRGPGREVNVRVLGEAIDLDTLAQHRGPRRATAIVARRSTPLPKDVALVEDGFEDMRRASRVNGQPAQGLGIRKQRGANAVAVARACARSSPRCARPLPEGMSLGINFDSTRFIEESVHEIEFELLLAVILTGLVCWLFLGSLSSHAERRARHPDVAARHGGGDLLPRLHAQHLHPARARLWPSASWSTTRSWCWRTSSVTRESGKDRVRAARGHPRDHLRGAAATLAVIAIFIPVIFMKGIVGKFFLQFGVTLCIAVLLSYLEAVTLAPARCSQLLDTSRERAAGSAGRRRAFDGLERALRWVLRGRCAAGDG